MANGFDGHELGRLAGAPISWGLCDVPGWGRMLPPERVLAEMALLGLEATELGPFGYVPFEPAAIRERLDRHGLRLVAAFVPLVLHEASPDGALAEAERVAAVLAGAGAEVFVAAAVADAAWSPPAPLDDRGWGRMARHLAVRVHLKDVDAALAARLRAGELSLVEATQAGVFRPLGQGDAGIDHVIEGLERSRYGGWLVLEQDTAITGEEPPVGRGPVLDVRTSIGCLHTLAPARRERVAES
jgi:sugar phosphate isomerase/epimerase